jgi:hypothetical protein
MGPKWTFEGRGVAQPSPVKARSAVNARKAVAETSAQ